MLDDLQQASSASSLSLPPPPARESDVLVNPMPRLIACRVSHAATTNTGLQDLMFKNQGGYSHKEHTTTTSALTASAGEISTGNTAKAAAPECATVWAPGQALLYKAEHLHHL
jgi:hypothetical protein